MTSLEHGDHEQRIHALESKVAVLEGRLETSGLATPQPAIVSRGPESLVQRPAFPQPPPPLRQAQAQVAPLPASPTRRPTWLDSITTEVALKWVGLGLVFLAAAFALSTAINRGWIGPEVQLAGAVGLGIGLIGLAVRAVDRVDRWAQPLALAGLAILFTSAGAAPEWLGIGDITSGTVSTSLLVIFGVFLSRRYAWLLVGVLDLSASLIVFAWVGTVDEFGFGAGGVYTVALAYLLHPLAIDRRWPTMYASTVLVLMVVQLNIAGEREDFALLQVVFVLTALAHWLTPIAFERRNREDVNDNTIRFAGRLTLLIPVWLWGATVVLQDLGSNDAVLVSTGVAVVAVASALALRPRVATWLWASQVLGAAVAISVGLVYWLDGTTLLGALAAQAAVMLVLARRIDDRWFWWQSIVFSAVVSLIALAMTIEAVHVDARWSADAVHLGVFAVALGVGLANRGTVEGRMIAVTAHVSLMIWVASVSIHFDQGQLIISAVWAAVGVAIVAVGLGRQRMLVARVGLATLAVVVAKLLSVDLAEIDTFWRAGLFFLVGLGFLWLSYSVPALLGRETDSP